MYLPSDRFPSAWLIRYLSRSEESAYIRVGRNAVPDIYSENDTFKTGKAKVLKAGKDIAIVATGETVYHALKASEKLEQEGISALVIDMFTMKPFDTDAIISAAKSTRCILSVEEHSIFGGLGAAIAEITSQHYPTRVKILGIPDENAVHGKPLEMFAHYEIDMAGIYRHAVSLLDIC